jgi:ABC-type amino acid transport substrate-binding protein
MTLRLVFVTWLGLTFGAHAETLTFGTNNIIKNYFPHFETIVQAATEHAGFDFKIENLPSKRSTYMLAANQIDGEIMRIEGYNQIVPNAIRVGEPIMKQNMYAIVSSNSSIDSPAELYNKTMGINLGTQAHYLIAKKYNANQVNVDDFENTMLMVAAERLDFTGVTKVIAQRLISEGAPIRMLEEPLMEIRFYIWLAEKNRHKVNQFEQSLRATSINPPANN